MPYTSKEKIQSEFGNSLREERKKADLSQEELARLAGLDRSYVGSVERGERNITLANIVRLVHALDITPAKLLDDL
jgi:transcriptional regulator with XRE-family HTH domain